MGNYVTSTNTDNVLWGPFEGINRIDSAARALLRYGGPRNRGILFLRQFAVVNLHKNIIINWTGNSYVSEHRYRRSSDLLYSSGQTSAANVQIQLLMSSNEDDSNNERDSLSTQGLKKRRIQRACDICRRKKSMSNRLCHWNGSLYCKSSSMSVSFISYMPVLHSLS
jgi:hypothetical protein